MKQNTVSTCHFIRFSLIALLILGCFLCNNLNCHLILCGEVRCTVAEKTHHIILIITYISQRDEKGSTRVGIMSTFQIQMQFIKLVRLHTKNCNNFEFSNANTHFWYYVWVYSKKTSRENCIVYILCFFEKKMTWRDFSTYT